MQFAKECTNFVFGQYTRCSGLAPWVNCFGKEIMLDAKGWIDYHYYHFYELPDRYVDYELCDGPHRNPPQAMVDKLLFVTIFSGWCVVSMVLNDRMQVQKKCERNVDAEIVLEIVKHIMMLGGIENFAPHLWREENIAMMDFPTHMLSTYREHGLGD